jgi:hypothetical protein
MLMIVKVGHAAAVAKVGRMNSPKRLVLFLFGAGGAVAHALQMLH